MKQTAMGTKKWVVQTLMGYVSAFSFCVAAASAQTVTPLSVVGQQQFPDAVYKLVAIGGPNDTRCDHNQNLWFRGLRGYSETTSSVVRYSKDKDVLRIDIDAISQLAYGSIEHYTPLPDGGVLALVRTVAEYSEIDGMQNRPKVYRDTFAVRFSPTGAASEITKLDLKGRDLDLSALAELNDGWLLVGSNWLAQTYHTGDNIRISALLFNKSGSFRSELTLPDNSSKAVNGKGAPSRFTYRPTIVKATDGTLVILRGFSGQAIYRVSSSGGLLGTSKLQASEFNFWSPRVVNGNLFMEVQVSDLKTGELAGIPIVHPRSAFALFKLETGELSEVFTLDGDYAGALGCVDLGHPPRLSVIQQNHGDSWIIKFLAPTDKKN